MAEILALSFDRVIISTPCHFKESRPEDVFTVFRSIFPETEFLPVPLDALERAMNLAEKDVPIVVTGSFYMAAEIRKLIV